MKTIQNKETSIILSVDAERKSLGNCFYSHLIQRCLNQGKQGGFDYTDIENRLAISKALKHDSENIELEDSYFNYLKKLVESMKWQTYHEDILTFKNDIVSIK